MEVIHGEFGHNLSHSQVYKHPEICRDFTGLILCIARLCRIGLKASHFAKFADIPGAKLKYLNSMERLLLPSVQSLPQDSEKD